MPNGEGPEVYFVYLFDGGGGDKAKITNYAEKIYASHEATIGRGEFIGSEDSQDAAREKFEGAIRVSAEQGGEDYQRRDERFGRLRDRWLQADYSKRPREHKRLKQNPAHGDRLQDNPGGGIGESLLLESSGRPKSCTAYQ